MPTDGIVKGTAEAVKGIFEAVPLYEDAIQPAAKEIGTALQTLAKTVNMALAPVSALVWGYEQIKNFVETRVAEKLKDVPPEAIITPKPNVAGPALEALRYTGHEESLQDLYANLLASSMDARIASGVLPSFSEILKQLTADEARLVRLFSGNRPYPLIDLRLEYRNPNKDKQGGQDLAKNLSLLGQEANCAHLNQVPIYLDNLCRLGLSEVPALFKYTVPNVYDALEQAATVQNWVKAYENNTEWKPRIIRKGLVITDMGKAFYRACVLSPSQHKKDKK